MGFKVNILDPLQGDCFWLTYGDVNAYNILIDTGRKGRFAVNFGYVCEEIKKKAQKLNLVVITHIDDDHIGGFVNFAEKPGVDTSLIERVWFNSLKLFGECMLRDSSDLKLTPQSGKTLEIFLDEKGLRPEKAVFFCHSEEIMGMKIRVIAPGLKPLEQYANFISAEERSLGLARKISDYCFGIEELSKKEYTVSCDSANTPSMIRNRSSIALIAEYLGKKAMFLGDSFPEDIVCALTSLGFSEENKIYLDVVKIAHHGSSHNTNDELLKLIDCKNFIVTGLPGPHYLPDKEALARIVKINEPGVNFYGCVQKLREIFTADELKDFDIRLKSESEVVLL